MNETIIRLDSIPTIEFMGINDDHLRAIESALPELKISYRDELVKLKGADEDLSKGVQFIHELISHYRKFGFIDLEVILDKGNKPKPIKTDKKKKVIRSKDLTVHGINGHIVKARS